MQDIPHKISCEGKHNHALIQWHADQVIPSWTTHMESPHSKTRKGCRSKMSAASGEGNHNIGSHSCRMPSPIWRPRSEITPKSNITVGCHRKPRGGEGCGDFESQRKWSKSRLQKYNGIMHNARVKLNTCQQGALGPLIQFWPKEHLSFPDHRYKLDKPCW